MIMECIAYIGLNKFHLEQVQLLLLDKPGHLGNQKV